MLGSSLLNTVAGILSLVAGLGSSIVVARLLGVEGTGIVAYALWVMTVATLLSDIGIPQALLRFVAKEKDGGHGLVATLGRRFAATTGLMAGLILAYALWLSAAGDRPGALVWAATAVLFLAYAYSTLALGAGQGLGQFRQTSFNTALGCLLQPVCVAAGALVLGPAGAILGHVFRHLPQALALRRHVSPGPAIAEIPPAVSAYARNNWLSGGLTALLGSRVEFAIIGAYFGIAGVGQYAAGATMAGMIVQMAFFLAAVLVPLFSSYHDRGDRAGLARAYQRSLLGLSLVLAPICFGGAAVAPVLVPLLFGADFAPAGSLALVLVAFAFASVVTTAPFRMMLAQERSKTILYLSLWEGFGCIAALLVAVPLWGPLGAAWVKGLTATASALFCLWYCRDRLGVPFRPLALAKVVLAAFLCAAAAAAVLAWKPDLAGLILAVATGAVVYLVLLAAFSAVPAEDYRLVEAWLAERLPAQLAGRAVRLLRLIG